MQATNAITFLLFTPCCASFRLPVPRRADAWACWLRKLFAGVQGRCSTSGRRRQHSEEPQVVVLLPSGPGRGRRGGAGLGWAGLATHCAHAEPAQSGPTQHEPRTQAGCHTLDSSDLVLVVPPGSEPGSALTRPRDSCWRVSALCTRHGGGRSLFLRRQPALGLHAAPEALLQIERPKGDVRPAEGAGGEVRATVWMSRPRERRVP